MDSDKEGLIEFKDSDGYEYDYDLFILAKTLRPEKLYGFYTILIPAENEIEGNNTLSKIEQVIYNDASIKVTGAFAGAGLLSLKEEESFIKELQNFMSDYCSII